jgi:hypothetical protein
MDRRKLVLALVALVVVVAGAFGLSMSNKKEAPPGPLDGSFVAAKQEKEHDACASNATYARLKQVAFDEAVRIRNADPANLDTLATHSVVRMEDPVVKNRDEELNVTVCSGRFILELPPGAERAFGGQRRLAADIEYSAQAAADGSGLVYEIRGAEPIINKLAAFDLSGKPGPLPAAPAETQLAEASPPPEAPAAAAPEADTSRKESDRPAPKPEPATTPKRTADKKAEEPKRTATAKAEPPKRTAVAKKIEPPAPPKRTAVARADAPERPRARARSSPSFACRPGQSRSERMVCNSDRLAARDRAMSSVFYSALADADPPRRRELRRTRDKFLNYRERCGNEACVAEAYEGRIREIRDIMSDDE